MDIHALKTTVAGKRVFVGLSGGVDSAVSAALLQKAGALVTGVFIQGWYPPGQPCSWREDRRDAMRVAAHLGIPFYTLDASEEYKKGVIDYLLSEYRAGNTPNPDVMCNREVKFGAFYRYAKAQGAEYIATGHYARTSVIQGEVLFEQGIDHTKDQSYFLWAVPKEVLAKTLFPVGGIEKKEVRNLAKKFSLPVFEKKDSQGICFLGSISVEEFLKQEIKPVAGEAYTSAGEYVGNHGGSVLYTIGERVTLGESTSGPWFVIAKDLEKNTLTVSHTASERSTSASLLLREVNLNAEVRPDAVLEAQYRYHGPKIKGYFSVDTNTFTPSEPYTGSIAKGQSLVLYQGTHCLGGGIIE